MRSSVVPGDARRPSEAGLAAGSVDCIVTSPPYWNLKLYGGALAGEIGHGQKLDEYLADMRVVLDECLALVKDTGVMWLVADTLRYPPRMSREFELLPLPMMLAELAQDIGWRFQDMVVWRKNKTLPYSGAGKLRNQLEYVLLLTKTRSFKHSPYRLAERHQPNAEWLAGWPERYHPLGRHPANVWTISIPTQGIWAQSERLHFCPLPAELVRRCIDLTSDPGDVVFDPFAGIGTVPAQAEAMGRRGIGIELNPDFIRIFEKRTRPAFLAAWEEAARGRQLARDDQTAEAALLLRLRALKAGRELSRHLEGLAQSRPADHVAASVQSIIVRPLEDPETCIDVLAGRADSLSVRLFIVADVTPERARAMSQVMEEALRTPRLRALSLSLSFEIVAPDAVDEELYLIGPEVERPEPLFEFDLSRHGAFTERPMKGLFHSLPRLLTTIALGAPVHPSTLSPLEQARAEGERKLLQSLLGSGMGLEAMAQQLRLPHVELEQLLQDHGLAASALAFAVELPEDLMQRAEDVTQVS